MGKKLKISKKMISTIMAGLTFVLIGSGCGKSNVSLTKRLRGLSTVQATEDGTECKVDEYIKSYLESLGTDMQTEEIKFATGSISENTSDVNEALARILTAELKAVVAEALNVSESELLDFQVEGVYRKAFIDKDRIDEYAISFKYDGKKYSFMTTGESKTWCFYIRTAEQGQIDTNPDDSESYAISSDVYDFAGNALSYKAVIDPADVTIKLAPGSEEYDSLLGLQDDKTFAGKIYVKTDWDRRSATRNGG